LINLGVYQDIKTELEDLALKYTDPERYNSILNKMEESKEEQQEYIEAFTKIVETSLTQQKIDYYIKGRPKSIYSIYRKMESQGVSFEEVYDKFAIRIIYKSEPAEEKFLAWKIYSIVTDHFRPNPTRLRDWISSPKSTGYEALHITVMGPKGKWVEVQIRSERMHEIAEKGYAAHFKYKHGDQKEEGIEMWLNRLQEVFENSEANAVDFVEDFKLNLYSKEIFVFTPNGEIKSLPKGATPLDFAFSIHTGVGLKTRGAKVNNKLVPLNYVLKSGETVEIITAENAKPTKNWLNYATTAKARSKIKNALKEETKAVAAEGKEILVRKLKQLKITLNEEVMNELVSYFKTKTSLDIYYQAGTGEISNQMLKEFVSHRTSFFGLFKNKVVSQKILNAIGKITLTAGILIPIILTYFYNANSKFFQILNVSLTGRLSLGHKALSLYGVHMFGQRIDWELQQRATSVFDNYLYVDSSFVNILLHYGVILLVVIWYSFYQLNKRGHFNTVEMLVFIVLILHSMFDPQFFELMYNPLLLLMGISWSKYRYNYQDV